MRACSEAKDCQLYNDEVTQLRKKNTEDVFEGSVFTYNVDSQNQDNSTKVQSGRFSKYVFLLQHVTGNSPSLKLWAYNKRALLIF